MKHLTALFFLVFIVACSSNEEKGQKVEKEQKIYKDLVINENEDYLIAVSREGSLELGSDFAFVNTKGDTIIPYKKYSHNWTDTLKTFAIVFDEKSTDSEVVAIDRHENVLFDVYMFDNAPDEASEGLFRVKRNDKVGYANTRGEIKIPCQYKCAFPFENGKAKVAYHCTLHQDGEYTMPESEEWVFIDREGNKVE
ncbi:MAG: WG repeat-containing protein [Chitinophagales bacterium]